MGYTGYSWRILVTCYAPARVVKLVDTADLKVALVAKNPLCGIA
jgi:hypothetical protein